MSLDDDVFGRVLPVHFRHGGDMSGGIGGQSAVGWRWATEGHEYFIWICVEDTERLADQPTG